MVKKQQPIRKKLSAADEGTKSVFTGLVGPCYINRAIFEIDGFMTANGNYIRFGLSTKELTTIMTSQTAGIIGYDQVGLLLSTNGATVLRGRHVIEMYGYPLMEGQKLYAFIYNDTEGTLDAACILNWAK